MINNIQAALLENLNEFLAFARKRLSNTELAAGAVQDSLLKAIKRRTNSRSGKHQGLVLPNSAADDH